MNVFAGQCTLLTLVYTLLAVSIAHSAPVGYTVVRKDTLAVPAGYSSIQVNRFSGGSIAGFGSGIATSGNYHALLWNPPTSSAVDLNPTGYTSSSAIVVDGSQIVGSGSSLATGGNEHALLWNGTAQSALDLNPLGFNSSDIKNAAHGWQVGTARSNQTHAFLWHGTASSAIDLNPSGSTESQAIFTDGIQQIGSARVPYDHAILWAGTAASAVDLNPPGYQVSLGLGFSGTEQVGEALFDGAYQAMKWSGTAASAVNLNPPGWRTSAARATNGTQQVGNGKVIATSGDVHALLWTGTANSFVDLGALLPVGTYSYAESIDSRGHVFGWGGLTTSFSVRYAIEWAPVPEPSTFMTAAIAVGMLGLRTGFRYSSVRRRSKLPVQ